ncbi:MAG: M20 family peptidase [Candidatus Lokiarchaeota archaeon]|nr:M20 family peptidase [Candidatus Lokiarchaeota archaeon]
MNIDLVLKDFQIYIKKNRKRYLEFLKDLIKIPSISAYGDPDPLYEIVNFINIKLQKNVITTSILDQYDANYPLLIGEKNVISQNELKKPVLFMAHLDVQPPGDEEKWTKVSDPFDPIEENDNLYGRGSVDTKTQVAAEISAIDLLTKLKIKSRPLRFLYTTDEEIGSSRSTVKYFNTLLKEDSSKLNYFGAINGENTNQRIVLGCKGIVKCRFTARNPLRRAHSGRSMFHEYHPVLNLSQFLTKIRKKSKILLDELNSFAPKIRIIKDDVDYFDELSKYPDEIILSLKGLKIALGEKLWDHLISTGNWNPESIGRKFASISFNPGNFISGSLDSQTIVPDDAISDVDIRLPPNIKPKEVIEKLKIILKEQKNIEMKVIMPPSPEVDTFFQGAFTSPTHPFIKNFFEICNHVYEEPRVIMPFSTGTSDDRFLEQLGIAHLKFGSIGRNNHGFDEYVYLPSYFNLIKVYALMMMEFSNS